MKLNKTDSGLIFALMQQRGWEPLMKLLAMTIADLNSRETQGTNTFEKLRSVFTKEGQVKGLTEFFKGLEDGESLTDK